MALIVVLLIGALVGAAFVIALQERRITNLRNEVDEAGFTASLATLTRDMLFEYGMQLSRFYSLTPRAFAPGPAPDFVFELLKFFEAASADGPAEIPASLVAMGLVKHPIDRDVLEEENKLVDNQNPEYKPA